MIEIEEEEKAPGAPAWMATFADLMSLLMCFFVLLLSFSEMDVQKYKQVAGSMKNAFGVQNQVKAKDIPKGTSVIAREFSPGRPQPTQINAINQKTTEFTRSSLQVGNPDATEIDPKNLDREKTEELLQKIRRPQLEETLADAEKLRRILKRELEEGKVDIETNGQSITVRIRENGSFPSASATLDPDFVPVIATLRTALKKIRGKIAIEGHTDNVPIYSARYFSNWDLSASRALAVTHELARNNELDHHRFVVVGLADTIPAAPNTSSENRARNRRVEIVIRQGMDSETAATVREVEEKSPRLPETFNMGAENTLTPMGTVQDQP
tara:strand:- start:25800 stop:26777 length:978 start_codon:yes stop_codon:yes gene_type:complete